MAVAHAQTRAKVAKAAKASPRREARARREVIKRPASSNVNAGTAKTSLKERPNWLKSSGEGNARAHAHEFPQLVQLLRASQSC